MRRRGEKGKLDMRGIGGPLLCIGDLLSDVGEGELSASPSSLSSSTPSSSPSNLNLNFHPAELTKIFQENYDHLNEALARTDHSWTALTLQLCSALETANKLVQSTNSQVETLTEKVGELERVIKRGDSAIAAAKALHSSLNQVEGSFNSRNTK
ncbi:hypothetical protein NMG60_11035702 [Bertholletia excelsa]